MDSLELATVFYWLVLGLIGGGLIFGAWVEWLNMSWIDRPLPQSVSDIYDNDRYQKSQDYLRDNTRLDAIRGVFSTIVMIAILVTGLFNQIDLYARDFGYGEIGSGIIFYALLFTGLKIVGLPFSIYSTFVIEEKYGFNKTTPKTYVIDLFKAALLGALIGLPILALVIWILDSLGALAWLYGWASVMGIQIFILFIAPVTILPLFNKLTPLTEGDLSKEIKDFAESQKFALNGIFTMDGSKRSTKANAFFTGFGQFRRIVLFDTLVEKHTVPELMAILAHEIGHYKLRHIFKMLGLNIVSSLLMFYVLGLLLYQPALFEAFSIENQSVYIALFFIGILYSPIARAVSLLSSVLSRKHEFEADAYSVTQYRKPNELINALKKLAGENLTNLTPHPVKVFLEYSHPPIDQRIAAIQSVTGK